MMAEYFNAGEAKENNIIGSMIARARKARGMNAAELSAELGKRGVSVQRGAVTKWELGISVPSAYQFVAVCSIFGIGDVLSYFPGAPLLNSEGMRKVDEYRSDLIATGLYSPAPSAVHAPEGPAADAPEEPDEKLVYVNFSVLRTSAGRGCFLDGECFEPVPFPESAVPRGADFAVRVSGDSMEPRYHDGQTVFVKRCSMLRPGEAGLFILDGEGFIKIYEERLPADPDVFTDGDGSVHMQSVLVSCNRKYSPIVVSEEMNLRIVGKIL